MLKGKMYYKNKMIKYKVIMKQDKNDISIVIKTRLGKHSLFPLELILEEFLFTGTPVKKYIEKNKFLRKWNNMSSIEIKYLSEEFIKDIINKDIAEYNKDWKIDKLIDDIPECKPIEIISCDITKDNIEFEFVKDTDIKDSLEVYLSEALLRLSKGKLNSVQANLIAIEYIDKLNLHNTVNVHKAINWYAKGILNKIETDKKDIK